MERLVIFSGSSNDVSCEFDRWRKSNRGEIISTHFSTTTTRLDDPDGRINPRVEFSFAVLYHERKPESKPQ